MLGAGRLFLFFSVISFLFFSFYAFFSLSTVLYSAWALLLFGACLNLESNDVSFSPVTNNIREGVKAKEIALLPPLLFFLKSTCPRLQKLKAWA